MTKNEVIELFFVNGLLVDNYVNANEVHCHDIDGYRYRTSVHVIQDGCKLNLVRSKDYALYNIKHYLFLHNSSLRIISDSYVDSTAPLKVICDKHSDKGVQLKTWTQIKKTSPL